MDGNPELAQAGMKEMAETFNQGGGKLYALEHTDNDTLTVNKPIAEGNRP